MKFQLGEIRNMKEPLGTLMEKEIPIKAAWKLNRLIKNFDKELGDIEGFRVDLIKKLGKETPEGDISVPNEKMEEFVNGFNELLMTEVEVEFEPIDVNVFGDIQMSSRDMMAMDKLFV